MSVRFIFAKPVAVEQDTGQAPLPTLGEIIDKIAELKPDVVVHYDLSLGDMRVLSVEVVVPD